MSKISIMGLRADLNKLDQGIEDDATPGSQSECYRLADKIVKYCIENGIASPYNTIISVEHLGTKAYGNWRSETARQYFEDNIPPPGEAAAVPVESVWDKEKTLAFQHASANLLSSKFIVSERSESAMQLYKIDSHELRQVRPVEGSPPDVAIVISRAVVAELESEKVAVTPDKLKLMLTAFYAKAKAEPAPVLLGQPGDDAWCLHRATVLPDPAIDFARTREFLDRLNDPEAFSAWVYGVYSGRNRGRQMLYIHDQRGEGAKSVVLATIGRALFGDRIYTSFPPGASTNDPHTSAHFIGKKLVIIGDCKNPYILHSGVLKELSGDDKSFVNPKYVQPYSVRFECRVVVASNHPPFIVRDAHNTSRTLYLELAPLSIPNEMRDVRYGDKIQAELPGFLAYARTCYERLCANDYAIEVNSAVQEATELCIRQCETLFSSQFDQHFEPDAEGSVSHNDWNKVCTRELKLDVHKATDFLQWVMAVHGAAPVRDAKRKSAWSLEGIRLKRQAFQDHIMPEAR